MNEKTNRPRVDVHELKEQLEFQKTLIRELNHRVMNQYQLAISLTNRLRRNHAEESTRQALTKVNHQLRAFCALHELLMNSESPESVSMNPFLSNLVDQIFSSLGVQDGDFSLETDFSDGCLSPQQATYCGLILTELLMNAYQHGVDHGSGDRITVQFVNRGERYQLRVTNNGSARPEPLNGSARDGRGLSLVHDLTEEGLKGRLHLEGQDPFTTVVEFPSKGP